MKTGNKPGHNYYKRQDSSMYSNADKQPLTCIGVHQQTPFGSMGVQVPPRALLLIVSDGRGWATQQGNAKARRPAASRAGVGCGDAAAPLEELGGAIVAVEGALDEDRAVVGEGFGDCGGEGVGR